MKAAPRCRGAAFNCGPDIALARSGLDQDEAVAVVVDELGLEHALGLRSRRFGEGDAARAELAVRRLDVAGAEDDPGEMAPPALVARAKIAGEGDRARPA